MGVNNINTNGLTMYTENTKDRYCFFLDANIRFPEGKHQNRSNISYGGTEQ